MEEEPGLSILILDSGGLCIALSLLIGTFLVFPSDLRRKLVQKMADYLQMMQMKQTQAKLCEPLYDAIEESDFKRGIKLANSSKLRSIPLAQALKAYCLACNKEMSAALDAAPRHLVTIVAILSTSSAFW